MRGQIVKILFSTIFEIFDSNILVYGSCKNLISINPMYVCSKVSQMQRIELYVFDHLVILYILFTLKIWSLLGCSSLNFSVSESGFRVSKLEHTALSINLHTVRKKLSNAQENFWVLTLLSEVAYQALLSSLKIQPKTLVKFSRKGRTLQEKFPYTYRGNLP